jgi:Alg9-like mannosyltransferase family
MTQPTAADPGDRERRLGVGLGLALLLLFAAKLVLAWRFYGYLTGDDLEVVETAGKYAFGLPYTPWNIRCLFYPLVLVFPVLALAVRTGVHTVAALNTLCAVPSALASTAAAWLVFRVAQLWKWPLRTSLVAGTLYAFHWLPLGYGSTPYPRPISAALFLAAFLVVEKSESGSAAAAGGLLCAAALAVRYSDGVVIPALALWIFWRRRRSAPVALFLAGTAAGSLIFVGLPDALTWGQPFASLRALIAYHRPAAGAVFHDWGRPWYFYLESVLRWAGPAIVLLILAGARDRRIRGPLFLAAGIVALLSLSFVRDWRFLQSAVPLVALAAAPGWERLGASRFRAARIAAWFLLALSVGWGLQRTVTLLRDKSQAEVEAARYIVKHHPHARCVLLEQAWAYGDRLYFPRPVEVVDLAPTRPLDPIALSGAIDRHHPDVIAVYLKDLDDAARYGLATEGYREQARFSRDAGLVSVVWTKGNPRPPEP